ncbi:MAG: TonB-dependent receptor [Pseudomonadota bacterium]
MFYSNKITQALFSLIFLFHTAYADEISVITVESTIFDNQSVNELAQSAEVLSGDELERKKVSNIGETVKNELGVSSTYFAPGASRPIIRGLGSNRVRVLENGIDSLDVSSVSEDHAVTIDPYFATQIEILRGPATLQYGPGAIGGIVNIINNRIPQSLPDKPFNINAGGTYSTVSDGKTGAIEMTGAVDSFAWHVDGLKRDTNDYDIPGFANEDDRQNRDKLKNSDVEVDNYSFGASHVGDQSLAGIAYTRFDTNYGVPGALEGDIRIDVRQYRYDSHFEIFEPFSNIESITLRSTYNNYRHFEIEEDGEVATTFRNKELESRLEVLHDVNTHWTNAYGLQYNDREFSATGEEAFVEPVDENRYGIFAISNVTKADWLLEGGARYDRTEYDPDTLRDRNFDLYALSLGVTKLIANDLSISVYAAHSERAPQEVALYADGAHLATVTFEVGDDDLNKEKSNNIELSLKQEKDAYSWALNTYYNLIDDYVYLDITGRSDEDGMLDPNGEFLFGTWSNEDAEFYGVEAEFVAPLATTDSLALDGRVFGDYIRAKFRDGGDVPRIPPARVGLGLDATYGMWEGGADIIYFTDQKKTDDFETDTDGYTMLNAGLTRNIDLGESTLKLLVTAENLLDEEARQSTSFQKDRVPLPGRNFNLGLTLEY